MKVNEKTALIKQFGSKYLKSHKLGFVIQYTDLEYAPELPDIYLHLDRIGIEYETYFTGLEMIIEIVPAEKKAKQSAVASGVNLESIFNF